MDENFDISEHLKKYTERYQNDLTESITFLNWLNKQKFQIGKPTIRWSKSMYRIVYGGYHPLSVSGSLAAGGRFNIGGSQMNSLFSNFSMKACLYAASSLNCARKEAGEVRGNAQEYLLKPLHVLHLWNLKMIIEKVVVYPRLEEIINNAPIAARWELQKVPKISQILAHYLRQHGGDGIIYPSTKDHRQKILAFFIKDDNHSKNLFKYSLNKRS